MYSFFDNGGRGTHDDHDGHDDLIDSLSERFHGTGETRESLESEARYLAEINAAEEN